MDGLILSTVGYQTHWSAQCMRVTPYTMSKLLRQKELAVSRYPSFTITVWVTMVNSFRNQEISGYRTAVLTVY